MCTRQTIVELIALYRAAFPSYKPDEDALRVLYSFLDDIPDETLIIAARACISEPHRAFAPSIGELRGKIVDIAKRTAGIPSTWEAWEMITTNRPIAYYHNCQEADEIKSIAAGTTNPKTYNKAIQRLDAHLGTCQECGWRVKDVDFPEIVQRVAKRLGWPEKFPNPANLEVDRAHFTRSYDDAVNQATNHAAEPADVRKFIANNTTSAIKTLTAGMQK